MTADLQGTPGATARAPSSGNLHPKKAAGGLALTVGAIGVVYGDIGTSPLYAFKVAATAASGSSSVVSEAGVLGVLSLIFWSLILIVTIEYVVILLRADNKGEGGTLALMALAQRAAGGKNSVIFLLGIIAASLFYGDAMLTPALSVLSAVEGLEVATPALHPFILPLGIIILVSLFLVQSRGTAKVAALFGPIVSLWFIIIGLLGAVQIVQNPAVLAALSPHYGLTFLFHHYWIGLITLGAVFLAVTGGEALYADLGHFGRRPIQLAWLVLALPSLVLNYFGQGAMVLRAPETLQSPFFLLAPDFLRLPLVIFATIATVIAGQAVITGAYSLSRQAVQLGLLPRLAIRHTSESHSGQVYMPQVNTFLLIGVLLLVGLFRTSSDLASAYGIAVTGTMVVTTALAFYVIWKVWRFNALVAGLIVVPFLLLDLTFFAANLLKVLHGGWFPLLLGLMLMIVMWTWRRGSRILFEKTRRQEVPLTDLVHSLEKHPPPRISGTAVFLTGDPDSTPTALLHSLKHFKVLHEKNVIMTVKSVDTPRVDEAGRLTIGEVGQSFTRITVRYGFMEIPHLPKALAIVRKEGLSFDIMSTTFFLSRRSLRASGSSGMPLWQDKLFVLLARNADDASSYFRLPTDRVVEIGTQVII